MMPNDFQLGKRSIITSACGALLGVATDESGSGKEFVSKPDDN